MSRDLCILDLIHDYKDYIRNSFIAFTSDGLLYVNRENTKKPIKNILVL
jgi:hypothetical protein